MVQWSDVSKGPAGNPAEWLSGPMYHFEAPPIEFRVVVNNDDEDAAIVEEVQRAGRKIVNQLEFSQRARPLRDGGKYSRQGDGERGR